MKYIQIDIHFMRDLVAKNILAIQHVHTTDQLADLFTKPLSRQWTDFLRDKIGLYNGSPFLWRHVKETDDFKSLSIQA